MWLSNATSQVWPSGAALATTLAPIAPAAPGLFSTTICQPRVSSSLAWTRRATGSVEPPGGKGTINLIGALSELPGQSTCALTTVGAAKVAATLPMSSERRRTIGILDSPGSPSRTAPTQTNHTTRAWQQPCERLRDLPPSLRSRGCPRSARLPQLAECSRCVALSQCDGRNAMNRPDTFARRCKRHFVRWLAAVAALLATSGAVEAETVLRIVMNSDLKILDPIWNTAFVIRDHGYMIYDTLFATDADGEIRPQMVDKTEVSADKLTYTFTLRDGLKWHDGQPVTAEDCVASIKRWAARDTVGQKLMTFVLAVEARDA